MVNAQEGPALGRRVAFVGQRKAKAGQERPGERLAPAAGRLGRRAGLATVSCTRARGVNRGPGHQQEVVDVGRYQEARQA